MDLDEIEDLIRRYLSAGIAVVLILIAPGGGEEPTVPRTDPAVVTVTPSERGADDLDARGPGPASGDEPGTTADGEDTAATADEDTAAADDEDDTAQDDTAQDDTAQDDTAQDDTAQDDTAQDDTAQDDSGEDRTGQDAGGEDGTGQDGTDAGPGDTPTRATPPSGGTPRPTPPPRAADPDATDRDTTGADDDPGDDGADPDTGDRPTPDADPADPDPTDADADADVTDSDPTDSDPTSADPTSAGTPGADPTAPSATSPTAAEELGWGTPVQEDDFTAGLSQWDLYEGPGHAGQGMRSPSAATVQDGVLTLTGDAAGTTAGMCWTQGQRYGRWEGRVRAPASDPSYDALLLLWPDDDAPGGGEVDFMEMQDPTRRTTDFFLHHGPDDRQVTGQVEIDATRWHTWAVDWAPDAITAYVDGEQWFRTTDTATFPPGPMHLCVQLDWFPQGPEPVRESRMQVDWVRRYAPEPAR
ncbi:glycoside hydrolase family 16 protein [Pseudonocardia petroleophila]|uniref:Glycoside hydrolase family 16 protein n=1 Tax=Pseudonocardia petroleophila TaxID=37331 RepID=A0A7G7MKU1_9PSEU|nr:glycoside hydrolase family 16 protein [Pseudonocardia petroleophila]QNG53402.1 glycoside hydrolase family 16 protein [Pseudonocardia petroleophila]